MQRHQYLPGTPAKSGAQLDYFDAQGRPDLQRLVEIFGGYDKITPSAWAQWDADCAAYRSRMITIAPAEEKRPQAIKSLYPPQEECCRCYARGTFGYRAETLLRIGLSDPTEPGELLWFCDRHKPAKYFADARR
jgi:hypothetical protein